MRNLNAPRIKDVGLVTLGTTDYHLQYYYPNGGSQYIVYVYKKGAPHKRGLTFSNDEAFFNWLEKQPKQASLFD